MPPQARPRLVNPSGWLIAAAVSGLVACGGGGTGASASAAMVRIEAEAAGSHCSAGGSSGLAGFDVDGDGVLSTGEVTGTQYVCNTPPGATGPAGADGLSTLVLMSTEAAGA